MEMTFDPLGKMTYRNEAFSYGTDSLDVTLLPEFNSVDSTFFCNGREIKWKVDAPDYSITEINSYNDYGNLSCKERITV